MDDHELKKKLTPDEYRVLREKGTEAPYSGEYVNETRAGMYACKVCGNQLFSSDTKSAPGTGPASLQGWPSFHEALPGAVALLPDDSRGMHRTEVVCAKCNSHLGHLFDDDSTPTGKHFCMNSVCLDLQADEKK
jgi:peptide-methionine (R)-S-oxide reductase